MVASQIAIALTNARAYRSEARRAEALAELDRAKTEFFNNVSHEFRTPLTLMLGPLEEERRERPHNTNLDVAHRNSVRLLKLVNILLDFSRIEAGRTEARYQPTDLAAYSADLASGFRSALERAGLTFHIDCPPCRNRSMSIERCGKRWSSTCSATHLNIRFTVTLHCRFGTTRMA